MRKLIIQIPCYNEEETLGVVLESLPREVPGVDAVEWLVIDDGSGDRTAEIAAEHGVDHIVKLRRNRGLAQAFLVGLDRCIKLGADIIVNTDADNQYDSRDIPKLVRPITEGKAEIVVGARPISNIAHFSLMKKVLQSVGSLVVRMASGTNVPDAPSGFRAMTRDAAMRLNVFSSYSYTLETIIQAGHKNIPITSVPIRTNEDLRPSRLAKSMGHYIQSSLWTIVRIFMTYKPFRFFAYPGIVLFGGGFGYSLYWSYLFYFVWNREGQNEQRLWLASICMILGTLFVVVGFLADLIGVNRQLLEDIRWRLREQEYREHNSKYGR